VSKAASASSLNGPSSKILVTRKPPGHHRFYRFLTPFSRLAGDRRSTIRIVARHCKEAQMEISKRPHFNRRIVALVLFLLIALSYLVLTLVDGRDPNQAHPTEVHHERQA
jgi:hypothetical protein